MKRGSLNFQGFQVFKRHLSRLTPSNEILFALLRLYTRTTSIDREKVIYFGHLVLHKGIQDISLKRASRLMSNTKLKIKHNDQSEKRQHNKQPMGTQAHCPKRGKTRVTESVREVTHVVYFSLSLAPTDAFPPFFPMRKTDYFSFSALKNSTTRPALTPLCLRCIILCLECMFYSRFYFKS